jgi:hypothetical protein
MIALVAAFLFVTKVFHKTGNKKYQILNIGTILYALTVLGINLLEKENFNFIKEAVFIAKTIYPVQIFLVFYIIINEYNVKKETVIKYLGANAIIMSLLILIPQLMGTSKEAYRMGYEGTTGWFNAANETGAIFSFLLVIIIWLANKNKNNWLYLIGIPLVVFSSYLIGTKVALGATLALLLMSILYLAFRERKKSFKIITVLAISFVMLVVSLNSAPAVVNLERVDEGIKIRQNNYEEKEKLFTKEQIVQLDELERLKEKSVPIITKVLSSRDIYVLQNFEYFQDASLIRKIVGMGFAAEYGEKPKVTEMDFFDFFFAYGILGSGIVLILFIKKIRDWLRVEKEQISEDKNMFIILIGVLMLLAIAFVAGHVFFAPSVSFYLAIGIVLLIKKKKRDSRNKKLNKKRRGK